MAIEDNRKKAQDYYRVKSIDLPTRLNFFSPQDQMRKFNKNRVGPQLNTNHSFELVKNS